MKILCPCPEIFSEEAIQILQRSCEVFAQPMDQLAFEHEAPLYDGVLVRFSHQVNGRIIDESSSIRYVITPTTGLTHIDIEATKHFGVTIFHLRKDIDFLKELTNTAEHAMGLLLSLVKKIPQANHAVLSGTWQASDYIGGDLKGKTIGIVGFGRVGSKFAEMCRVFEMNVIAYSPNHRVTEEVDFYDRYERFLSLCDIVSFHVHATPKTHKMFNKSHLKYLKPGAIIINTARAEVVDQDAIIEGLVNGNIGGVGLDVLENPERQDCSANLLVRMAQKRDDVIITPHLGGMTTEAIIKADAYVINEFLHRSEATETTRRKNI